MLRSNSTRWLRGYTIHRKPKPSWGLTMPTQMEMKDQTGYGSSAWDSLGKPWYGSRRASWPRCPSSFQLLEVLCLGLPEYPGHDTGCRGLHRKGVPGLPSQGHRTLVNPCCLRHGLHPTRHPLECPLGYLVGTRPRTRTKCGRRNANRKGTGPQGARPGVLARMMIVPRSLVG